MKKFDRIYKKMTELISEFIKVITYKNNIKNKLYFYFQSQDSISYFKKLKIITLKYEILRNKIYKMFINHVH